MELADAVGLQAGNAQHLQHAFRYVFPHGGEAGMMPGFVDLGDNGGQGIANARDFFQAAFGNQLVNGHRAEREIVGGAAIGPCPVRVTAFQFQPQGQFAQQFRDFGGSEVWHVLGISMLKVPTAQFRAGSRL